MKILFLIALAVAPGGITAAAPKVNVKPLTTEVEVYRSDAVEELQKEPQRPAASGKSAAIPKLAVDELILKFDDPNPPTQAERSFYVGLSVGGFRARGTIESSAGESFNLGDNAATNSFSMSFGGSRSRRAGVLRASEQGFVGETTPWRIGMEGKFQWARQAISRGGGFVPDGTTLQSTLAAFQPWASRGVGLGEKIAVAVGAEFGYFQYAQASSLSAYRFTRSTPTVGLELALLYDLSLNWAAKAQVNTRSKFQGGEALELPAATWAIGGRFQW